MSAERTLMNATPGIESGALYRALPHSPQKLRFIGLPLRPVSTYVRNELSPFVMRILSVSPCACEQAGRGSGSGRGRSRSRSRSKVQTGDAMRGREGQGRAGASAGCEGASSRPVHGCRLSWACVEPSRTWMLKLAPEETVLQLEQWHAIPSRSFCSGVSTSNSTAPGSQFGRRVGYASAGAVP